MSIATLFTTHLSNQTTFFATLKAAFYLIAGYLLARISSNAIQQWYEKRPNAKYGFLLKKIVFYVIFILFVLSALHSLGVDLHVLLGATGILTVALGFAAQTSTANLISGLFLLGDRTLHIGDNITLNGISGEVVAIDLLSIKIKQADNTLVRIPNEMILKSPLTNLSHFPRRRLDCNLTIPFNVPLSHLETTVLPTLKKEPLCLAQPEPQWQIKEITPQGVVVQLSVWSKPNDFTAMKNQVWRILHTFCLNQTIPLMDNIQSIRLLKENQR